MELKNVVKFFIFLIVIVFDPLAVALIIAFNGLIGVKKKEQKKYIVEMMENDEKSELYNNLDDLMEENYKNYQVYGDAIEENQKMELYEPPFDNPMIDEKETNERMDIIGQNGNEGLHYDTEIEKIEEQPPLKWEEYMHPDFPWQKRNLWINNSKAVNYWLKSKGGTVRELAKMRNEEANTKTY
jgi:hypothetical protein